jgi:hypothetical protein
VATDHFIQAALLGRWGRPTNDPLRERVVRARMKISAISFTPRAQSIAAENNLYPTWLEKFWQVYEGSLPHVADQLEHRRVLTDDDKGCLLMHVAALKPRTSSFLNDLNEYQAQNGLPAYTAQELPLERAKAFIRTIPYVSTWRWRVLHPEEKESFVINDRGLLRCGGVCLAQPGQGQWGRRVPGSPPSPGRHASTGHVVG